MFPPIDRASLFDRCLEPLREETGVDLPSDYQSLLKRTVSKYTKAEHNACKIYLQAVNTELLEGAHPTLLNEDGEYHPELLTIFYTRIRLRILAKIKKRGIAPVAYFNLNDAKNITIDEHGTDIEDAIKEEVAEITTVHETLSQLSLVKDLPKTEIDFYKYENTWFRKVNNDIFLDVLDVILDTADKGNSLGNKVTHLLDKKTTPTNTNTQDNVKNFLNPSPFQITGMVISFLYLGISILTPFYKKYKLKYNDPIINKWSMRYFVPSVVLCGLGLVAMLMPAIGMWIGIVFSAYSLFNNIFKVSLYFYYYNKLNRDLAKNTAQISRLNIDRNNLQNLIAQKKERYKLLIKESAHPDAVKACADSIVQYENEYVELTEKWLAALSKKEELEVKKLRTQDKVTGLLNILRLATVVTSCVGVILSLIPFTMPIGATILLVTFCVGTALLTAHYINKFNMLKKEKALAKEKCAAFNPTADISSTSSILKEVKANDKTHEENRALLPDPQEAIENVPGQPEQERQPGAIIHSIFNKEHTKAHLKPKQNETYAHGMGSLAV